MTSSGIPISIISVLKPTEHMVSSGEPIFLPQGVKEAAYKGLVRPVLEYGSSVWDPHTKCLQD